MHGVGDSLDLLFERFVSLPQGLHRILKSAVRHLIGREAFRKELGACLDQFLRAFFTLGITNHRKYRFVMQGSYLDETLVLVKRPTPELVRPAQREFAATARIFIERRTVFVFKIRVWLRLASNCAFH